ncbi:uncharacterized protein LOC130612741 [Hydractinia symbiolongicarpus]|uniref:uncharacterized protein LOC130612741 n=1 Tax=Hydractinia symbiolongicarpus TaxID=13093 RepID=UPI00254B01DA|nr:uncharacterized protein LOC130612741 [Hydractinia symbiolongicarpus]
MANKKSYQKRRSRKRKGFNGANVTASNTTLNGTSSEPIQELTEPEPSTQTGASAAKLDCSTTSETIEKEFVANCNIIIESDLLMSLIFMIGRCPDCAASVSVEHLLQAKMGMAHFLLISCAECPWNLQFCSSKECDKPDPVNGRKGYDINRRTVVAFRENCIGFSGIEKFCRCMNMPQPMTKSTFENINSLVHNAYVQTSHESMATAAKEVHEKTKRNDPSSVDKEDIANIAVSGDGAWQKRGFSSLNGVMTLIADGKCIDTEVMSKKCRV